MLHVKYSGSRDRVILCDHSNFAPNGQYNEVFYTDGIHLSPRGTAMLVSNWKRSLYPDQPRGRSNVANRSRDTRQYRQDGNRQQPYQHPSINNHPAWQQPFFRYNVPPPWTPAWQNNQNG